MTREHKLAIIVGFSLVLVVGILISDHLSPASLSEPADTLAIQLPIGRRELPPAVVPGARPNQPDNSQVAPPEASTPDDAPVVLPTDEPSIPEDISTPPSGGIENHPLIIKIGGSQQEERITLPPSGGNPAPRTPAPTDTTGRFAEYTVKPNDALSDIARQHLGSAARWRDIAQANPTKVGKNGEIRSGDVLRIPLPANSPKPSQAKPDPKPTPAKPQPKPATTTTSRTYVVQAGDSLSQIAARTLGSSKRMNEILELNKDRIDDADEIYSGLTLRLPPR